MRHLRRSCALCLLLTAAAGCGKSHKGSDSSPIPTPEPTPTPTPNPEPTPTPTEVIRVTDPIAGDTTWQQGKVYVVSGPLAVNATLTLEGCAVVKFDGAEAGLDVGPGGKILANGVADCPVVFTSMKDDASGGDTNQDGTATSPARRDWRSVALAADAAPGSTFRYAKFLYAGAAAQGAKAAALDVRAGGTTVDGCTFAHDGGGTPESPGGALDAGQAQGTTQVTGSAFFDDDLPIVINQSMSLDATNTFSDATPGASSPASTYNGIFVAEGAGFTGTVTWGETEVAYVLPQRAGAATTSVNRGAVLALAKEVVVKLPRSGRIIVDGVLKVEGVSGTDKPVVFTSIADDARPVDPSDTGGDGATNPDDAKWSAIYMPSSGGPHIDGQNLACFHYDWQPSSCIQQQ